MAKVFIGGPLTADEILEVSDLNRDIGDKELETLEGEDLRKLRRLGELLRKAKNWFEPPATN